MAVGRECRRTTSLACRCEPVELKNGELSVTPMVGKKLSQATPFLPLG